jgi:exopolysaccharide production protein ExoQ
MPPTIALFAWATLLVALLHFDPARVSRSSPALWVPLIWVFIVASRLPSQWTGGGIQTASQALEEGNSFDRSIYLALIVLAIIILVARSFQWGRFVSHNIILVTFIFFALMSVIWSDFPFVSFKHWFRDLGNYLVILVVSSDPRPVEALSTLLRRACYLLISLSVLLVKYFPHIAIQYNLWTGAPEYIGATTSKNMLGVLCLISGIFFFWDIVTRWSQRKQRRTKRILIVNVVLIAMTLWLLKLSNSATSRVCLLLACLVIMAIHSKAAKHNPALLKYLIPVVCCLYLILAFGFDVNGQVATALGRDATLTGRTNIWKAVLSTNTNSLLGAGYESFWLGPRLRQVWLLAGGVNEAHNGYLELYLNLGFLGLLLLLMFMLASYRAVWKTLARPFDIGSLGLALWTTVLFYNVTEAAAFKGQLLWIIFLLTIVVISSTPHDVRAASARSSDLKTSESQGSLLSKRGRHIQSGGQPTYVR